jgi:2-phospho-L-lactate guanylyltransferase
MTKLAKAVIPIKRFSQGKTRLAERLGDEERARLSKAMFDRVLGVSLGCPQLQGAIVLTDDSSIACSARGSGAEVLEDPAHLSPAVPGAARLSALIDAAFAHLRAEGVGVALVLMGDLPRVEAADLSGLIAALADADVALAPDLRGVCTNALALRLNPASERFRTAFGGPNSFETHLQRARDLGLTVRVETNPRLGLDLDLPTDLDLLAGLNQD